MAHINLLPWREQLREERKKRFLVVIGGMFVLSAAIIFLGDKYFTSAIENQDARNAYIQGEIAVLDSRIKEISELKTRRQQLLERMKIIQDLQGNRPVIGHVFDQSVRLPDGSGYKVILEAAPPEMYDKDPEVSVAAMSKALERYVSTYPTQYMWSMKRFKNRPDGEPRWY